MIIWLGQSFKCPKGSSLYFRSSRNKNLLVTIVPRTTQIRVGYFIGSRTVTQRTQTKTVNNVIFFNDSGTTTTTLSVKNNSFSTDSQIQSDTQKRGYSRGRKRETKQKEWNNCTDWVERTRSFGRGYNVIYVTRDKNRKETKELRKGKWKELYKYKFTKNSQKVQISQITRSIYCLTNHYLFDEKKKKTTTDIHYWLHTNNLLIFFCKYLKNS